MSLDPTRHPLSRRSLLAGGAATAGLAALAPMRASAQDASDAILLPLRPGASVQPIPIAITDFVGGGGNTDLARIITDDLRNSALFQPVDKQAFVEQITNPDRPPNFAAWRSINAQAVVTGRVIGGGNGFRAQFRLWDVQQGKQISGQQYNSDPNNARRIGHIIADAIFKQVTGFPGHFDTRIVFVDESGPKDKRRKRVAVMDQDGANVRYLTRGDSLVITPRFSPTSQQIAYMSFGDGDPRVLMLNLQNGQRSVVGNFPGMTFAPRFSPNGRSVIMSIESNGAAGISAMDLSTRSVTQITNDAAIDTAPCYSPDGSQIVFESDRGGTQQIYVMSANGGTPRRISFSDGARYSTPVWSPVDNYIGFTRQAGGKFGIGIMRPDGTGEKILTEGFHNEGPSWAPNGLYLTFFRDVGQGPQLWQISVFNTPEVRIRTPSFASDPSWSGPLTRGM